MKKISTILPLFLFFGAHLMGQSPWVHPKGEGYVQFGLNTIPRYQKVFLGNFNTLGDLEGSIAEYGAQLYAEYGLGNRLELQASVPFRVLSSRLDSATSREAGALAGLGNIEVGLKHQWIQGPVLLSGQLLVGLPTGASQGNLGLRTAYQTLYLVPTVSSGYGREKWYFFVNGGVGIFTGGYSSDWRLGGEFGHRIGDKIWVMVHFSARESFVNGDVEQESNFLETYSYVNNQSFNSLAFKFSYDLKDDLGLTFGTNLISVRANNLPFQRPISLSVFKKF